MARSSQFSSIQSKFTSFLSSNHRKFSGQSKLIMRWKWKNCSLGRGAFSVIYQSSLRSSIAVAVYSMLRFRVLRKFLASFRSSAWNINMEWKWMTFSFAKLAAPSKNSLSTSTPNAWISCPDRILTSIRVKLVAKTPSGISFDRYACTLISYSCQDHLHQKKRISATQFVGFLNLWLGGSKLLSWIQELRFSLAFWLGGCFLCCGWLSSLIDALIRVIDLESLQNSWREAKCFFDRN